MNKIKRGVSLYSYQDEFYTGKMTLEDCIERSFFVWRQRD